MITRASARSNPRSAVAPPPLENWNAPEDAKPAPRPAVAGASYGPEIPSNATTRRGRQRGVSPERVAEVKRMIAAGEYLNEERLDGAIERMFGDVAPATCG